MVMKFSFYFLKNLGAIPVIILIKYWFGLYLIWIVGGITYEFLPSLLNYKYIFKLIYFLVVLGMDARQRVYC